MTVRAAPRPHALPDSPLSGAAAGLDLCVHCGFCLQACPTYLALDDENDSPRGRLVLMRELLEGSVSPADDDIQRHISQCLGCRGCETACPSGVPYGQLLEATRATLAEARPLSPVVRTILFVVARPALLATIVFGARVLRALGVPRFFGRLGGRVGWAMAMLDASTPIRRARDYTPRGTRSRGPVTMLQGCVMRGLFAETNRATARTLVMNDYDLRECPDQGCCGALHAHAGDLEGARDLARRNIAAFERSGDAPIAVNAAGCGSTMREYGHLLAGDPEWATRAAAVAARVRDISELLAAAGPRPPRAAFAARVAYDPPCHLLHAQRVSEPPITILRAIPGVTIVDLPESDQCCGGAGIYNLVEPEVSASVLSRKLSNIETTGADWIATGNPGCQMQIGGGLVRAGARARAVHPVDVLDAAYAAEPR